jgi:hypothetical protein
VFAFSDVMQQVLAQPDCLQALKLLAPLLAPPAR